jgi:hypothetical protein
VSNWTIVLLGRAQGGLSFYIFLGQFRILVPTLDVSWLADHYIGEAKISTFTE